MTDNQAASETTEPDVLWLPVGWVLERYQPIEWPTWEETRVAFERDHDHLDVLREDIATHGVRTPVELNPRRHIVHRGHHRLLLAVEAGVEYVPAVFAWREETTYWDPETRRDTPDAWVDDWEDDEPPAGPWVDTLYPVPAEARAVARHQP